MSDINTIRQLLKNHSISDYSNWLYHHTTLLCHLHIVTGNQVIKELKTLAKKQIDKEHYAGTIATLRKLHDVSMHPNGFYNSLDYEAVSLKELKHKIENY